MTIPKKEKGKKVEDDSLWGLLSPYKSYSTYIRILINEEKKAIVIQITDNPRNWLQPKDEKYLDYRQLKRSEIGTLRFSIKYLSPEHLIGQLGPVIGMKLPPGKYSIIDSIDKNGCYSIETNSNYMPEIIQNIKKIINLSPQKKYEILEKYFADNSGGQENARRNV